MIDIEANVFEAVYQAVVAEWPDAYVHSDVISTPPSFPAVQFQERDNRHLDRFRTQESDDQFVHVMYETQVYSNAREGKYTEAKAVLAVIDEVMSGFGFSRTLNQSITNLSNTNIARRVARYEAVVGTDGVIYRR